MKQYDYLVVGSGLYGAVFAHEAHLKGKKCLVLEKRDHLGGNIYCQNRDGINIHYYGGHIFHTSNKMVWDYVNQFVEFNNYVNSPIANYKGELYNLPFNMNTFHQMWGVITPQEAFDKISEQRDVIKHEPQNLEEQAISLVGTDIYEKLIKGYTEKQWGRPCTELPAFIIKRLPVRYIYDNNYFNDRYQGVPVGGYNVLIDNLLEGIEVKMNCDFNADQEEWKAFADKIIYTGAIDEYFDYCYGELEYRSLRFETEELEQENYQGNAVVNYTEYEIPYTRIIEHKHFEFACQGGNEGSIPKTIITKEYPATWKKGDEPYYPMNDEKNNKLYAQYKELAEKESNVIFGGRLGMYKYFDMHNVVEEALNCVKENMCAKN